MMLVKPHIGGPTSLRLICFLLASVVGALSAGKEQAVGEDALSPRTYIVHMHAAHRLASQQTHAHWVASHLRSLSIDPAHYLLYNYSNLNAFAVNILPHHLPLLRSSPAVALLYPDPLLQLHTTRSPEFLGLLQYHGSPSQASSSNGSSSSPLLEAATGDVIVGVVDTGVWPESESFNDRGMPQVPSRWRGACEHGIDFAPSLCNRKLIGARSFSRGYRAAMTSTEFQEEYDDNAKEYLSPRDRDGHGTHTASTAAGSAVANASLFGYAAGTARGMAIAARVAAYKVCWSSGCLGSDILAGIDSAISDGVDALSLSLGGAAAPYFSDNIAIATFAAVEKGIFVACSSGNAGPKSGTVTNTAPWIATVGAGTLDRDFPAYVNTGGGEKYTGVSLYSGPAARTQMSPLVYEPAADSRSRNGTASSGSNLCLPGTLDPTRVRGKVVLCDRGINGRVEKGIVVKEAGGVGMVLANTAANGEELVADSHVLPAVAVGKAAGDLLRDYVRKDPRASVALGFVGTVLGVRPSPVIAAFSSRGPNAVAPEILKPDIVGPGVNILAAWSGSAAPTGSGKDDRRSPFNILSGTSMSCPHVSGIAALLKAAHPDWSPGAIKSALMTTAYTVDNTASELRDGGGGGAIASPFAFGSGHIDPQKALSPGLVYDVTTDDYIVFLCSLGYSPQALQVIVKRANLTCSGKLMRSPGDLNYPSFSVVFNGGARKVVRLTRELTNVGAAGSVYDVVAVAPPGVGVSVKPTRLVFREVGQKLKFVITFSANARGPTEPAFGWISWNNEQHHVRSPIAITWKVAQ